MQYLMRLTKSQQLTIGLVYIALLILPTIFLDAYNPSNDEATIRLRNAAIAMPILTVFGFFASLFLLNKTTSCLEIFLKQTKQEEKSDAILTSFKSKSVKMLLPSFAVGVLITLGYNYSEGLLTFAYSNLLTYLLFTAPAFWAASMFFASTLIFITRYVINNFLDRDSLDLFATKELKPIADLVIYNVALSACFLALTPFFWLGKSVPFSDIVILVVVFVFMSCFLFIPILKVHYQLGELKGKAIERINASIRRLMVENGFQKQSEFFRQPAQLRSLASLLSAKNEIISTSDWPIDIPQGIKGALLSISIPLSWVMGSVIESWVKSLGLFVA